MKKFFLLLFLIPICKLAVSQKKPLDHSVYDAWQSIGERMVSNDGQWAVYTITPQEGDNELVIQKVDDSYRKTVARGYNAVITEDSRYVIFRIKPFYKETRDARIKKKKPEDMPKDSLAIIELGKDSMWRIPKVKSYSTPREAAGWAAYHLEKKPDDKPRAVVTNGANKKVVDSLQRTIDSLERLLSRQSETKKKKKRKDEGDPDPGDDSFETVKTSLDAEGDDVLFTPVPEGTDLVLRNLLTGEEKKFAFVSEYAFAKNGKKLVAEATRNSKDSLSKSSVFVVDLNNLEIDTISKGGNEFKGFTWSDDGSQLAFLAEREAKQKDLQRFFKVWYYKDGMDTAMMLVDKNSIGMNLGMTVSENSVVKFSKSGKRLFFGTAPIQPARDTTLVEIDLVKLDIWHYNDDYLQPTQLRRLQRDLQENFLAVYDMGKNEITQLGSREIPMVYETGEGDGEIFVGVSDFGNRVESQWTGNTKKDIYIINVTDGSREKILDNFPGIISPQYISPNGKYVMWYDRKAKHFFVYDGKESRNITKKIKAPLWNEEFDMPDDPTPYGMMRWTDNEDAVFIYDKFSVWRVDPLGKAEPELFIDGRKKNKVFRYVVTDPEKRSIKKGDTLIFRSIDETTKNSGLWKYYWNETGAGLIPVRSENPVSVGFPVAAKGNNAYLFTVESYTKSPDLYAVYLNGSRTWEEKRLSRINPQQVNYNWGTAELFTWKAYTGKTVQGIVYKPENFDPKKKYPLIAYFYETHTDGLHQYIPPSPTPSRLNVSFFVSRGYVVLSPDIHYKTGHPAKDCYNHVVSGVRALAKKGFVDSTRMGIQGQSWGGIQVAQLVTMTNLFKAAWAGAPVANMTSAYGGIRWESGLNRQFQYEKSQSRIGATLWEKPNLYIENSPLFHLPKVKTPLVIMHNDADGAVPWYQGIELFTGLRRLGKKVWMLNYNGEAHNLVERRNRKDIQIREQQFFDWLLKGEKPARWITEGVPAIKKGKDWGLEVGAF